MCCLGLIVSSAPHVFYAAIEEQPIINGDQATKTNQDQPAVEDEQVDPEIKEQQEKTKNEDVSNSEGLDGQQLMPIMWPMQLSVIYKH